MLRAAERRSRWHSLLADPIFHRGSRCIVVLAAAVAAATFARADSVSDQAAIRERLQRWTAAFNSRDAAGTCALFAPDLVYSVPEVIHGTRESMCANLTKLFSTPGLQLHYDNPDIHEIITSGDVAMADAARGRQWEAI
jgi:hypothetical protein